MVNPIRVAIAGYGLSAQVFHAPFLKNLSEYDVTMVYERNKSNSASDFPEAKIVRSFDEILSDEEVELVVITTPNQVHYAQTKAALLAGKHVVVEKPFTVSAAGAEELVELAKKRGKTLSIFHNRRWDSDFLWLLELVNSDVIVYEIDSRFDRFRDYLKGWKEEEGEGNGILYDIGSHLIDQMLVLFGDDLKVTYVDLQRQRKVAKSTDYFEIHFKAQDTKIILKAGMACSHSHRLKVDTSQGTYIKRELDVQENLLKEQGIEFSISNVPQEIMPHYLPSGESETIELPKGSYDQFYKQLYVCIRENKPNPVTGEEALNVIRLIEEISQFNT